MSNPLLEMPALPAFGRIAPEHVEPAIDTLLQQNREQLAQLLAQNEVYTWKNLIQPLEEMDDRLDRAWSPVSHMNSVVNSDALREAYNACLSKLSDYATELGQNEQLYAAYKAIADSPGYEQLEAAQKKIIDNALRDFHLSGVDLPPDKKQRYKEIQQRLSSLTTKFEENLLDATHAWYKPITDEAQLAGLPDSARAMAKQAAEEKGLDGWVFTLDFPSYYAVMTHAADRALRSEMHEAYVTRASDQGPNAGQWDNSAVMDEILALRHELAQLLGFANYAERSLATKMAESPQQVLSFLHDLARRAKPVAEQDLAELGEFARQQHGLDKLEPWDIAYYSEKLRQHKYAISQEDLKPYFPETRVIPGMFEVVKRLYGIAINEVEGVETWHPDVRFYEIRDAGGELRGQFYLDLYTRAKKRGGAWMDDCRGRLRHTGGELQTPVAYLTCNLTPPVGDQPALFTHDEVITLFHEFGHGLHHMLTRVDHIGVSGINGVAWDAVELPSQFMENWCWEREALDLIAAHYQTGEPIPDELYRKMYAAKNFQAGMLMVRQLEFSLFDFRLHLEYDPQQGGRIQTILDQVREEVSVVRPAPYNRFQHGFAHIFAGGYAAGYYSYMWAEVLSADAFSLFEENGIFDRPTGEHFLNSILEQGGTREPMDLFVNFRGREPQIEALLRHTGIAA
ncbi:oligopeptidase A [Thiohalophilus thiocyanatoxydans]|uniref:oligopeptidase A n=1 Tax=Thiohalophilus thiocyanatoxydans TaxID=381308 RepID=A0A4R8J147_9GAMM|nr:oligopeptidase A [Thiohalophilus thiocyanatoxydans]TDY03899.1 oligopeptidase A [Thiohalophilus thiocyanatoxydans]